MERVLKQGFSIDYSYNIYFTEDLFSPQNTLLRDFFKQKRNPDFKQRYSSSLTMRFGKNILNSALN